MENLTVKLPKNRFSVKRSKQSRKTTVTQTKLDQSIAFIGMSGRFSGAENVDKLWDSLSAGENRVEKVSRWNRLYESDDKTGACHYGSFLDDIDHFDPTFFNISGLEAIHMDPQQRLFLQEAWKALEDAGYAGENVRGGRCGVYAGCLTGDYHQLFTDKVPAQSFWGNASSVLPARIAYYLDLKGPAVAIDTACSSSLVAIHLASQALQANEVDYALAGGVLVQSTPSLYRLLSNAGMLSPSGQCYTFDDRADGFVPGEGVGIVVLKRLNDALADGDHIYGVIKGSGVNQDGSSNGITAPSASSQERLECDVYNRFGINPEHIQMIEAHGTGTVLGDPIEVSALTRAFANYTKKESYCALGAIKTNLGHLTVAAGVASVIKVLLSLQHKTIPASLNYQSCNRSIQLKGTPFFVNESTADWDENVYDGAVIPRCAAINSFGFGGTNAHMVIEEAPQALQTQVEKEQHLIVLSAQSELQLIQQIKNLQEFCTNNQTVKLANISYTLLMGRRHCKYRFACIADTLESLLEKLTDSLEKGSGVDESLVTKATYGRQQLNDLLKSWKEGSDTFGTENYLNLLELLRQSYLANEMVDYSQLFSSGNYFRLSLPSYPFLKQRYWVENNDFTESTNKNPKAVQQPEAIANELMSFEESWREQPLVSYSIQASPLQKMAKQAKTFVCFLTDESSQQRCKESIVNAYPDAEVVFISRVVSGTEESECHFVIDNNLPDDEVDAAYATVFKAINDRFGQIASILYFWAIEDQYSNDVVDVDVVFKPVVSTIQTLRDLKLKPDALVLAGQWGEDDKQGPSGSIYQSWLGFERTSPMIMPDTALFSVYHQDGKQSSRQCGDAITTLCKLICDELHAGGESALYIDQRRHTLNITSTLLSQQVSNTGVELLEASLTKNLKTSGCYLITGGLGGLGLIFARHLASLKKVNLVLLGRSEPDSAVNKVIEDLNSVTGKVKYYSVDISDKDALQSVIEKAKNHFDTINGVIHSAGIATENTIFEQSPNEFLQILSPKIQGTLVLDELTKDEALDFVCYFSSASSILGDFGSCNYAIANRFQNSFSAYRNDLVAKGHRSGKTLAICWPLWENGGMRFSENNQTDFYLKSSGQTLLQTQDGIKIFDALLSDSSQGVSSQLVMTGNPEKIQRFLGIGSVSLTQAEKQRDLNKPLVTDDNMLVANIESVNQLILDDALTIDSLVQNGRIELKGLSVRQCIEWDLKDIISRLLIVAKSQLDAHENLAEFGFDSITLASFAEKLTQFFHIEITPSVFFGHPTIRLLTEYLAADHHVAMIAFYHQGSDKVASVTEQLVSHEPPVINTLAEDSQYPSSYHPQMNEANDQADDQEAIAIIGMSGRFPQARTIDQLWHMICDGLDATEDMSNTRFDWQGETACQWIGCLPGVDEFDALFFDISEREAQGMEPRQRLLLQECWNAIEDAAYGSKQLKQEKIGVFVGAERSDYENLFEGNTEHSLNHEAMLAARVSYHLDIRGPNMAINTACSSGLVAAHVACSSLRNNECDSALVAGLSLILSESSYIGMSRFGMLSDSEQCAVFDNQANGIIPGEAVAVVLLKRLSQALKANDPVYAVINGSGVNYDGKTNGITAPSGEAQKSLIRSVYKQYSIDTANIGHIVAHGTGTKLGDPIEINALSEIFSDTEANSCAVTSTKANVGHTLAASGLVSLISLVQGLRSKTIPASIHCENENVHFNSADSGLYINKTRKPWDLNGNSKRMGAISAFGMSGTNAHMVVEEFTAQAPSDAHAQTSRPYYLLVLSAKTQDALQQKITGIATLLESKDVNAAELASISYTLLEGRCHFLLRCAVVIEQGEEAAYVLRQSLDGEYRPNFYHGQVKRDFIEQKALLRYAGELLTNCASGNIQREDYREQLSALADLFVQGYPLDWASLFGNHQLNRLHLPTYPFARDRFPIPSDKVQSTSVSSDNFVSTAASEENLSKQAVTRLHPLLHRNSSSLNEQKFTSEFSGEEFFLRDHVVQGDRVLPGVAYLELVREAITQSLELTKNDQINLCDVVWLEAYIHSGNAAALQVGLYPLSGQEIEFQIYSNIESVHCQGLIRISLKEQHHDTLDIGTVLPQLIPAKRSIDQYYEAFADMGIQYGIGHQGLKDIWIRYGETSTKPVEVIAKLDLPKTISNTLHNFILHPCLTDSALQASLALLFEDSTADNSETLVPFSVANVTVYRAYTQRMWSQICYVSDNDDQGTSTRVIKLDISLYDENGQLCAILQGFSSRAYTNHSDSQSQIQKTKTLYLHPVWEELALSHQMTAKSKVATPRIVWLMNESESLARTIELQSPGMQCRAINSDAGSFAERYTAYVQLILSEISEIILNSTDKVFLQIVFSSRSENPLLQGLSALLKTVEIESPRLQTQVIMLDSKDLNAENFNTLLENNANATDLSDVCYRGNKRWVKHWLELPDQHDSARTQPAEIGMPWRDDGVYLITGGLGGLGLIFASEIVRQTAHATLILTGRSALTDDKRQSIKVLEQSAAVVEYAQVDVANRTDVKTLVSRVMTEYGQLSGVLHSAGVNHDSLILKKDPEKVSAVLAPKVAGIVNLDAATQAIDLDLFMVFSSISAAFGNSGQSDYAAANGFMDQFIEIRQQQVNTGMRKGRSLTINWPLWGNGGMHLDAGILDMLAQQTGMAPLGDDDGMAAFYHSYHYGQQQVLVKHGNADRFNSTELAVNIQRIVSDRIESTEGATNGHLDDSVKVSLKQQTVALLFEVILPETTRPATEVTENSAIEQFAFDSLAVMRMTDELESTYGRLSKTLFFEYQTIGELADYFVRLNPQAVVSQSSDASNNTVDATNIARDSTGVSAKASTPRQRFLSQAKSQGDQIEALGRMDVAVIGLSGRFPKADSIDEYWVNLKSGRDCISEIPSERWSMTDFFEPDIRVARNNSKSYSKWGGFVSGVDLFDPAFFKISPREALRIDPQERLFLEEAYHCIEDAGYTPATLTPKRDNQNKVGVFVGVMNSAYPAGTHFWSIANRLSYIFNFHGPSLAVDTACSSSLSAIHFALESLYTGASDVVIAGGVNLIIAPYQYYKLSANTMLSEGAKTRAFGQGGDGFVDGEAVCAALLKPLVKAESDGDHIYGVIKGSSINSGGKTSGYSVPNPAAQGQLIVDAFKRSGVLPHEISYIEAHGTGTPLGDPVEISGLSRAFSHDALKDENNNRLESCAIGSAKSNIGHCESAAGIAGLAKVLLQLKYQKIAPSLHSEVLNPNIDFDQTPFVVQQELADWKRPEVELNGRRVQGKRMAGVSSFGAGGANAHVVLEEYIYPELIASTDTNKIPVPALIVLSAHSARSLKKYVEQFIDVLPKFTDKELARIAYTLQVGREEFSHRAAFSVTSVDELTEKLNVFLVQNNDGRKPITTPTTTASSQEIEQLWQTRDFDGLLQCWTGGVVIDWMRLYSGNKPRRISLPKYPYNRKRYWASSVEEITNKSVKADDQKIANTVIESNVQTVAMDIKRPEDKPAVYSPSEPVVQPVTDTPISAPVADTQYTAMQQITKEDAMASDMKNTIQENENSSLPSREAIVDVLVVSFSELLYIELDEVELDKAFIDMGLDSITGVEWVKDLNQHFGKSLGIELQAVELYDHVSINALADYLLKTGHSNTSPVSVENKLALSSDLLLQQASVGDDLATFEIPVAPVLADHTIPSQPQITFSSQEIQDQLVNSFAELLYLEIEDIFLDKAFIDMGLDSITGVEWVKDLNNLFGTDLQALQLYDHTSIIELTAFIATELTSVTAQNPAVNLAGSGIMKSNPVEINTPEEPQQGTIPPSLVVNIPPVNSPSIDSQTIESLPPSYPNTLTPLSTFSDGHVAVTGQSAKPQAPLKMLLPLDIATQKNATVVSSTPSSTVLSSSISDVNTPILNQAPLSESALAKTVIQSDDKEQKIAVIGMSGRYPDAETLDAYWDNLVQGKDSVREMPKSRWDIEQYYDPDPANIGKIYCRNLGALDDIDCFDSLFFNISPMEAEGIDPQHRLFLEQAYSSIEDAGYSAKAIDNVKCGVYLGIMSSEYSSLLGNSSDQGMASVNNSYSLAVARIAYYLNIKGPAISIDTACSSSLVAAHLGYQALTAGEIDMALVGGVSLYLTPEGYAGMCAARMLSPEGQCKAFDDSANGFVPGEGVGCVVLKRYEDAVSDGDQIHGVILGSGINQDGKTNGITAPSMQSQVELTTDIYDKYNIDPASISYVEMHGTGTRLGDPIELQALTSTFRKSTDQTGYCAIGSVKSNIGHTSAAAGVAGLHKVLLSFKHQQIVPSLHYKKPNSHFNFSASPFYVNTQVKDWHVAAGQTRTACVSSFGYSGTNAHMVLQEHLPAVQVYAVNKPVLVVLSAQNEDRLKAQADNLIHALSRHRSMGNSPGLANIAYTLQVGRTPMESRLAMIVTSVDELEVKLNRYANAGAIEAGVFQGKVARAVGKAKSSSRTQAIEVTRSMVEGDYSELAQQWVAGLVFDWTRLYVNDYAGDKVQRISLPTYAFAKNRYWVTQAEPSALESSSTSKSATSLHPLLHENTSDFSEQRYTSRFDGNEFFLKDHIVHGEKLLPEVAYLEMVREAISRTLSLAQDEPLCINDVSWHQPFIAGGNSVANKDQAALNIALNPVNERTVEFEVYSERTSEDASDLLHCQGQAIIEVTQEGGAEQTPLAKINVEQLKQQMTANVVGVEDMYRAFTSMGLNYGDNYRSLTAVWEHSDERSGQQLLARLELSDWHYASVSDYTLHPAILDSALHSSLVLLMKRGLLPEVGSIQPVGVESLRILKPCESSMWAKIGIENSAIENSAQRKVDVTLLNDQGEVCADLKAFTYRVVTEVAPAPIDAIKPSKGSAVESVNTTKLIDKTSHYLKRILSTELKLTANQIDVHAELEIYGINSISVVGMTKELELVFGPLPTTLFFEYRTIREVAEYFVENHAVVLATVLGSELGTKPVADLTIPTATQIQMQPETRQMKRTRFLPKSEVRVQAGNIASDIAIVGVSGRFPMANNINEFWDNLRSGKDCISEIPEDRWALDSFYVNDAELAREQGKSYSKWGGFISKVDHFDPMFFKISPMEAERLDPQERLFLEEAYHCIEDAGYSPQSLIQQSQVTQSDRVDNKRVVNRIAVFVGVTNGNYPSGSQYWSIANRVSYTMNFHGPSMAVDTACSSSLSALHLACESIHRGESDVAIAGGVNLIISPFQFVRLSAATMLSEGAQNRSFGAEADGFVDGEAVCAMVLKPLHRAEQDNDHIYGVIKGTAVNSGGKTNGYTVPNPVAQGELIADLFIRSGIAPETVSYIEANGTGTSLGDPIEIAGLSRAFKVAASTENALNCAIGSAKSNIGHCESAGGIAGVAKVLMQLKHGEIAPSLHSKTLNPKIDFTQSPFFVQQTLANWERPVLLSNGIEKEYPRIAGVSSFGGGGANAHVLIEEYRAKSSPEIVSVNETEPALLVLSAKDEDRLYDQVAQLSLALNQFGPVDLANIAYTLQVGREVFNERIAILAVSIEDLKQKLDDYLLGNNKAQRSTGILPAGLFRGRSQQGKGTLDMISSDTVLKDAVDVWWQRGQFEMLLELWVKGFDLDWNKLYDNRNPQRMSLPTYPFAKEYCWISTDGSQSMSDIGMVNRSPIKNVNSDVTYSLSDSGDTVADYVINTLSVALKYPAHKIERDIPLTDLGVDSLIFMKIAQGLQNMDPGLDLDSIYECVTADDVINCLFTPEFESQISKQPFDQHMSLLNETEKPKKERRYQSLESTLDNILPPSVKRELGVKDKATPVKLDQTDVEISLEMKLDSSLERELQKVLSEVLLVELDDIDSDVSFNELDEQALIAFIGKLNQRYQQDLLPTLLIEYPTIPVLADYIRNKETIVIENTHQKVANSNSPLFGILVKVFDVRSTSIHSQSELRDLGLNAATYRELARSLKQLNSELDFSALSQCITVADLEGLVHNDMFVKETVDKDTSPEIFTPKAWPRFPELIRLNSRTQGRPVFWIHSGQGGVTLYLKIAQVSGRPFYGIQSRGWSTDREPLSGNQSMALYYLHIIKTVQPEGPYDLGGFSLGGSVAFEVARLFQELGDKVNSLVMIDSLELSQYFSDNPLSDQKIATGMKSNSLMGVNFMLMGQQGLSMDAGEFDVAGEGFMRKYCIDAQDLETDMDFNDFIKQLVVKAGEKGLDIDFDTLMDTTVNSLISTSDILDNEYSIPPMKCPDEIDCYYFRNENGQFYGDFRPFYKINGDEINFDGVKYWAAWQEKLPTIKIIDLESPNHLMMMDFPKSLDVILEHCTEIYS